MKLCTEQFNSNCNCCEPMVLDCRMPAGHTGAHVNNHTVEQHSLDHKLVKTTYRIIWEVVSRETQR